MIGNLIQTVINEKINIPDLHNCQVLQKMNLSSILVGHDVNDDKLSK